MLQSLREKAQGWIAWIIVGMIALTFILYGSETLFTQDHTSKAVAKIDGTKITQRQLDLAYRQYLQQTGAASPQDPEVVKKELLESLIEDNILNQNAIKLGMYLSEKRMGQLISTIPHFQRDGQYSPELFYQFLSREGYSQSDFMHLLKDAILKQQIQQSILQTAIIIPQDIDALIKYLLQKRNLGVITIHQSSFKEKVKLTEDEIKKYYQDHIKEFMTDEQVGLEYVLLTKQDLMSQVQPTNEQIKAYYDENRSLFSEPERRKIAHILIAINKEGQENAKKEAYEKIALIQEELKKGESFESLAKKYSDDKATNGDGGLLNWISKGEMVPEFEKASFALKNKGDVSPVVQTQFGLHLIKLVDLQPEKERPFEGVQSEIIEKIKEQSAEEKLAMLSDQLSDLIYDHPESLQVPSEKLSLKIYSTGLFNPKKGPQEAVLNHPAVKAAIALPSVLEDRNNSDLIKIDGGYCVVRVVKRILPKEMPFQDVRDEIQKIIVNEKANELAKSAAQQQYDQIITLKDDEQKLRSQFNWEYKQDITRSSDSLQTPIIEALFSLPWPIQQDQSPFKLVTLQDGDVAILWLTQVEDGDPSKMSDNEKANFKMQLTKHYGELEYALYATSLFKQAKIQKNL